MRSPLSKDVTGVIVLLVIFVIAGVMLSGNSGGGRRLVGFEDSANPSVFNDRRSGSRGLFELTKRLGYKVDIDRTKWTSLPTSASVLICAEPSVHSPSTLPGMPPSEDHTGILDAADAEGVRSWLSGGRTLVLMASEIPAPSLATGGRRHSSGEFGDAFGLGVSSALAAERFMSFSPQQPVDLVRGVGSIRIHGGATVHRHKGDEVILFGVPPRASGKGPIRGEPVGITFPVGEGHVIVVADGYFGCNANISRDDNAVFLANILSTYAKPGDRVLFDEYHHGDIDDQQTIWTAVGPAAQNAAIQLLVVALVIAMILAPRFGSPKPLEARSRRNTSEYVTSLAGLYRSAHAAAPALEVIYRQFLRDVCSRLALPPDVSLEMLADAASNRGHVNGAELKRLLGHCERRLDQQTLTENELLDLVRQMERFRKELGID